MTSPEGPAPITAIFIEVSLGGFLDVVVWLRSSRLDIACRMVAAMVVKEGENNSEDVGNGARL